MTPLASLLPAGVVVAELGEHPEETALFPQEAAVVARSVEKRRREFAAVRHCARRALARLGHPPVPILPGERGAPSWPDGVVGSMTHCEGFAAAALARAAEVRSVGIDAEPHAPLPDGVLRLIALPAEVADLERLHAERPGICWDRLLFCAKEAVYKTWFPLTGTWLDFHEARVVIDPAGGTFRAGLLVPGPMVDAVPLTSFSGRWAVTSTLLLTAIAITRRTPVPDPAR
jgi:4'-phosphopantetheinyl transferase EntD